MRSPKFSLIASVTFWAYGTSFSDDVVKYATKCRDSIRIDGAMTVAYFVKPNFYKRLDPFPVKTYDPAYLLEHYPEAADNVLLQTACLCTEIDLGSLEYIIVPKMVNGVSDNALVICMFHEKTKDIDSVLTFPPSFLSNWMVAKYMQYVPRRLEMPGGLVATSDCVDKDGGPTAAIHNQNSCYYSNYAKFEKRKDGIGIVTTSYYGPFLGSQCPNFGELALHSSSGITSMDLASTFDYVKCSLLKEKSRLDSAFIKTGCKFWQFPNDSSKLVMVSCCCRGHNDPNCHEVDAAVEEKKILCSIGTLGVNINYKFAAECPYTIIKQYKRMKLYTQHGSGSLNQVYPDSHIVSFDLDATPLESGAITCKDDSVYVIEKGFCKSGDYCNLHHGLNSIDKRCRFSYGGTRKGDGCMMIVYRVNDRWFTSSSVWFDLEKSKLIRLYSANIPNSNDAYTVSLGFLFRKSAESSCSSYDDLKQYYVIKCQSEYCDWNFDNAFFENFDTRIVTDAIEKEQIPGCENGSVTFKATGQVPQTLPIIPDTKRLFGLYCFVKLDIATDTDNVLAVSITFGPVYPMPNHCNTSFQGLDGTMTYSCCYLASSDISYVNTKCHMSTILSVLNPLEEEIVDDDDTLPPVESVKVKKVPTVFDNADMCEQQKLGQTGTQSRKCQPGGHGCFHMKGIDDGNEAVIASCIGRGEKLIALHQEAFSRYHEALICFTDEAKNKCHVVTDGSSMSKLCCCASDEVKDHVEMCSVDSNMLFNTDEFSVKLVNDFKDDNGEN